MIRFALRCRGGHGFDGWFRSGADFDRQTELSLVSCPQCGSSEVGKALMSPAVSGTGLERAPEPPAPMAGGMSSEKAAAIHRQLQAMARELRKSSDDVGDGFAAEARRIHFGEAPERRIHGRATPAEVRSLAEDGVPALPLPALPEDRH